MRYPKSWKQVSLSQLYELDLLRQRTDLDAEETMNQMLAVLSGQPIEEIEKIPHTERIADYQRMTWLSEYPNKKPDKIRFKAGGKWYRVADNPAAISAGEYATLQVIAQDGNFIKNLNQILACLMIEQERVRFRWKDVRYDKTASAAEFHKKAELVSGLAVAQVYPYALFFSNLLPRLLETSLDFFEKQAKKLKKQAMTG